MEVENIKAMLAHKYNEDKAAIILKKIEVINKKLNNGSGKY